MFVKKLVTFLKNVVKSAFVAHNDDALDNIDVPDAQDYDIEVKMLSIELDDVVFNMKSFSSNVEVLVVDTKKRDFRSWVENCRAVDELNRKLAIKSIPSRPALHVVA